MKKLLTIIGISLLFFNPVVAVANLGDSLAKAKSRAPFYKSKYGAVAPLFETNDEGKIVWECWAAPPRWMEKELSFGFR